jgi:hypothetical protein
MPPSSAALRTTLLAASLALAACAEQIGIEPPPTEGSGQTESQMAFNRFPDMPLPVGGDISLDRTLVFGGGDTWFGRLVIEVSHGPNDMFDFYKQKLGGHGWEEITSIRAAVSVLTYSREDRVATIQIQAKALRGSEVTVTVSPKGIQQMPAATLESSPSLPAPVKRVQ